MEIFPIVTPEGAIIGKASRSLCHSGSMLLHPVVHLHIMSPDGDIFLQRRSRNKDIQPGRWDTAVGGHVDYGEETIDALYRETREELGITEFMPEKVRSFVFRSDREQELVNTYYTVLSPDFGPDIDPEEIEEARFWSRSEIEENLGKGVFTPNFEHEYQHIISELYHDTE